MVKGFIVKANTVTGDSIIDESITGFKYNNVDVICTMNDEEGIEINTVDMVKQILEITDDIDIEELKNKFVDFKNGVVSEETVEKVVEENTTESEDMTETTATTKKSIFSFFKS